MKWRISASSLTQDLSGDADSAWNRATGILLHPAIGSDIDEAVTLQGHQIRFVTVDLSETPEVIRRTLREIVLRPRR
jgi:5-methylcytosine-specific restriction enzyme subunit McrC